jgi:hypothetical protein
MAIRGAQAYDRYVAHTVLQLHRSGGALQSLGAGEPFLIGPPGERRDIAMLAWQIGVQAFAADPPISPALGTHRGGGRLPFAALDGAALAGGAPQADLRVLANAASNGMP